MPSTVLLSFVPQRPPPDDLRELLAAAGFALRLHTLGSIPCVKFDGIDAALIEVDAKADAATVQTRRWRAELGDEFIPIIWVLPTADTATTARGLDAGADAVLVRPFDAAVFLAQVRSAVRSRATAARLSARATEARLLGEQLSRAHSQLDRELSAAARLRLAFLPRSLPAVGAARFAVCHRSRARLGGDFYSVDSINPERIVFHIGDVIGSGISGGFLARLVTESLAVTARKTACPGEMLAGVNRELLRLGLDELPLVALLVCVLNPFTGEIAVTRAGSPGPVYLPAVGEAVSWLVPGPFLGTAETTYPVHTALLNPGDKLLISTDGTRPNGDPGPADDLDLKKAAALHRARTGQAFADAVGRDLLQNVQHDEDFTFLCVEIVAGIPDREAL